jgi:hypothetical protein
MVQPVLFAEALDVKSRIEQDRFSSDRQVQVGISTPNEALLEVFDEESRYQCTVLVYRKIRPDRPTLEQI